MTEPRPQSLQDLESDTARRARARKGASTVLRRRAGAALAVLGLSAAAAAGGTALWHAGRDTTAPGPDVIAAPASGEPRVTVLLDGWSVKNLTGPLTYRAGTATGTLQFAPVTGNDVAALAKSSPALLTQVAARTVTDDPTLECAQDGCRTSAARYPLSVFTDPSSAPLADVYRGYGIGALLYAATIPVDPKTPLALTAPGSSEPLQLDTGDTAAAAGTGYGHGRHLVAAGLGQLFAPHARWVGSGKDPVRFNFDTPAPLAGAAAERALNEQGPLTGLTGLGTPLSDAAAWAPDHLTYATSPTVGCGAEALCVPGTVGTRVLRQDADAATVCQGDARAVARFEDTVVEVDLPAPTHQFTANGPRWGAKPKLLSGTQRLQLSVLSLRGGPDGDPAGASGRVVTEPGGPATITDALVNVRFAGQTWKAC